MHIINDLIGEHFCVYASNRVASPAPVLTWQWLLQPTDVLLLGTPQPVLL